MYITQKSIEKEYHTKCIQEIIISTKPLSMLVLTTNVIIAHAITIFKSTMMVVGQIIRNKKILLRNERINM